MNLKISHKRKMIAAPATAQLVNLFPAAAKVSLEGADYLCVPHRPPETVVLRNLGLNAPTPILEHYDWPGDRKPFEVQKKTCALLTMNERAYVLNEMGTGKTKCALWAFDYLKQAGLASKMLVVAPLSTLKFTWQREVLHTTPHLKVSVVHHPIKSKRLAALDEDADIYIINHDGVQTVYDQLSKRKDIDVICIDELTKYRNGQTQRVKTMRALTARARFAWGFTGRPIPRDPTDAWAQATIITPHTVPKYFGRFRDELMFRVNQYKWTPKPDAVEKAFKALQPAVRYTMDDVQELPDLIERTMDIELGDEQAKVYKSMMAKCHALVENKEITAANAGAAMMKLLQISGGWVYTKERGVVGLDNDKRIEALMDIINDTDKKVLAFVNYKHALDGLAKALDIEGIEHCVVSGDTSASVRSHLFNAFQNTDKFKVLLAHPMCLSHGLTLTAATTIVWFSPVMDLEVFEQANARIRRVGQKHKQQIIMLQGTPVEKRIYAMLRTKQRVQDSLLELFEEASE